MRADEHPVIKPRALLLLRGSQYYRHASLPPSIKTARDPRVLQLATVMIRTREHRTITGHVTSNACIWRAYYRVSIRSLTSQPHSLAAVRTPHVSRWVFARTSKEFLAGIRRALPLYLPTSHLIVRDNPASRIRVPGKDM